MNVLAKELLQPCAGDRQDGRVSLDVHLAAPLHRIESLQCDILARREHTAQQVTFCDSAGDFVGDISSDMKIEHVLVAPLRLRGRDRLVAAEEAAARERRGLTRGLRS